MIYKATFIEFPRPFRNYFVEGRGIIQKAYSIYSEFVAKYKDYKNAMKNSDEQIVKIGSLKTSHKIVINIIADYKDFFKQYNVVNHKK